MRKKTGAVSRLVSRPLVHLLRFACGVCLFAGILVLVFAAFVSLRITDAPFVMPRLSDVIENKFNAASPDTNISVGTVSLSGEGQTIFTQPTITLDDVSLTDQTGEEVVSADVVELGLSGASAIKGELLPETMNVSGIEVQIVRDTQGLFNFKLGNDTDTPSIKTIEEFFTQIAGIDQLAKIELVTLRGSQIVFDDRLEQRTHVFQDAEVDIARENDRYELTARLSINIAGGQKGFIRAKLVHVLGQSADTFEIAFENLSTTDVANRVEALDWLRVIDARVDGAFSTILNNSESIGDFAGTLTLRDGQLRASGSQAAMPFEQVKAYFSYDKTLEKFTFNSLDITAPTLSANAQGAAVLARDANGTVELVDATMSFTDLKFAYAKSFAGLVAFSSGRFRGQFDVADNRLRVSKFVIDDAPYQYAVTGSSWLANSIWHHKYEAGIDELDIDKLMSLWPLDLIDKTRNWLIENITKGTAYNVKAMFNSQGSEPDFKLTFDAKDVTTTFLRTVPALQSANGRGQISNKRLDVWLDSGFVTADGSGKLNLAGSQFSIPDVTARPAIADVKLKTAGSLAASLYVLNVDRFKFLDKAGLPTTLGRGGVSTNGRFTFPLSKKTTLRDVDISVDATIRDFKSTQLVVGRSLTAQKLTAKVNGKRVTVGGPINVDGVQTTSNWTMNFKDAGRSDIKSKIPLSASSMAKFGVKLPKGLTKGSSTGNLSMRLVRGKSPSFSLTSNLVGLSMSVPSLNWSKAAKTNAKFAVSGAFGKTATVDKISLSTAGLTAAGALKFSNNGGVQSLDFPTFRVGDWLDTSARLTPTKSNTRITLRGGKADLRRFEFGKSGAGGGNTVSIRSLKLQVTDTIALHGFSTDLSTSNGTKGSFKGAINNATPVTGKLTASKNGTRIDVTAKDAGSVLRSANLFKSYRGGSLSFSMDPTAKAGIYTSSFEIVGGRLRQNNAIAELFNAMSVVGLLQQLNGSGIHFEKVKGGLEIRPSGVVLKRVSAVGPSMGLTANGWYDSNRKSLDLEGVVTPIYLLNGVFERAFGKLFGKTKGEGVFSFVYTLKGATNNPRVSVNPFSILTPGVFRRVFDQKVPIPAK